MAECSVFRGLKDKVVLVTGGTSGIGWACAQLFKQHGCHVTIGVRDAEAAVAAAEETAERGIAVIACDVRSPVECEQAIRSMLHEHGRLDILVNNAGVWLEQPHERMTEKDYDYVLDTNLKGPLFLMKHALAHMGSRRTGVVVNVASHLGLHGSAGAALYCASKSALILASRSLAREFADRGVRVACICPGVTDTRMLDRAAGEGASAQAYREAWAAGIPLKRFGSPSEIATLIAFLASDDGAYVTGAAWSIDGGITA